MQEKKQIVFKTPDITRMQEVVINDRTKIYIAIGADPEEARTRYWARQEAKGKVLLTPKKATAS
jgi:putative ubiquitin-RnfH superfamily antitoxin RatB of RatAB toxin-antitoxin module